MRFEEQKIKGVYTIDLEKIGDDRGFFARLFCKKEFEELGLNGNIAQINTSLTEKKDTFRGMHYQIPPKAEDKVIKCTRGSLYDITLDLRPNSPTFGQYFGTEISDKNRTMVYIPKGVAHGYLILEDSTELIYLVSEFYSPENERVIRWDDPKFKIKLPRSPKHLSEKDTNSPDFDEEMHLKGMENL